MPRFLIRGFLFFQIKIEFILILLQLFAIAMDKENSVAVVLVITGLVLLLLLLIIKIYLWKKQPFNTLGRWLMDIGKYAVKHFKELFSEKSYLNP